MINTLLRLFWRFISRYYGFCFAFAGYGLWLKGEFVTATFLQPPMVYLRVLFLSAIALVLTVKILEYTRSKEVDALIDFENALIALLLIHIILQFSGHFAPYLYPLNYILLTILVAYSSVWSGLMLAVLMIGLETARALFTNQLNVDNIERLVFNFLISLTFIGIFGMLLRLERAGRERAQSALDKLRRDGSRLDPTNQFEGMGRISPQAREQTNVDHLFLQDKLLGRLAEITRRALMAHSAVIMTLDIDSTTLSLAAFASDQDDIDLNRAIKLEPSIFALAVSSGQPVTFKKLTQAKLPPYYKKKTRIKSLIINPMFRGDHVTGLIVADALEENHFGQDEARFMSVVAEQAVENLHQVQLIRNTLHDKEQFAAFYEVANEVSTALKLEDVLKVLLKASSSIVSYDAAALTLVDEKDFDKSSIADVFNMDEEYYKGQTFKHSEGLVGWVTHLKTYLSHPELTKVQRPIFSHELKVKGIKSLLSLPLVVKDTAIGTLTFFWCEEGGFNEADRKILEVLALQASVSLENARMYQKMEEMAVTDGLTRLYNHRYFRDWLTAEIDRTKRMPIKISLILIDIDHFKKVNDTYGHPVGDIVLKKMAHILSESIRSSDLAARYGGEEFVLVLLDTHAKGAKKFADRVRRLIKNTKFAYPGGSLNITISMGISTFPENAEHIQPLIDSADKALYYSKENGRDRATHTNEIKS